MIDSLAIQLPLSAIDWGSVAGFLCLAAIVAAILIINDGKGPRLPGDRWDSWKDD